MNPERAGDAPDQGAKLRFIESDTGMGLDALVAWADRLAAKASTRSRELRDELTGVARLALVEAIDSYSIEPRPGHGRPPRFRPYAKRVIVGRILDEIRRWVKHSGVPPGDPARSHREWVGPRGCSGHDPGQLAEDGVSRRRRQPPVGEGPDGFPTDRRLLGCYLADVVDRPHACNEKRLSDRDAIEAYLATLPPRTARILRSIYLEGKKVRQVAASEGIAEDSVRRAILRARRGVTARQREIVEGL